MTGYTPFRRAYHTACVCVRVRVTEREREKEGMRLCFFILPTFPLGPCPPVSSISLSVFISLPFIANKVNEEKLEADGCTVHYSTAQYSVATIARW